ncbi:MAG TPA: CPBP family intramembrane glutamic endopeptidase [Nitrospiraceae bacterium]|nr:CPBP family intramembrane glutamic endopeptidase [Nitrospiraceae bacterium]
MAGPPGASIPPTASISPGAAIPLPARPERVPGLILLPVLSTILFYFAPQTIQDTVAAQFLPQALSYLGLGIWGRVNGQVVQRLGLESHRLKSGLAWGAIVGIILGTINVLVILKAVPWLGYDITFLTETPHARLPLWVMIPWFVCVIAVFVEVNFRGYILGRLLGLSVPAPLAVVLSAVLFSFDPFMVTTFRHLHWIAVWDGIVWGMMWIKLRNLYAVITAHAVEVIVMYCVVRAALS